jgi:hypothetical protein
MTNSTITTNELAKNAMLVKLHIGQYGFWKKEKQVTEMVSNHYGTERDMGQYSKRTIHKSFIENIRKIANAARTYFYSHTLPWKDNGFRLLTTEMFNEVSEELRKMKVEFEDAKDDLIDNIEAYKDAAQIALGDLYNPNDYPTRNQMEGRYCFDIEFAPIPTSGDFRVELNENVVKEIKSQIENKGNRQVELAMQDCWNRVRDVLSSLRDKMREDSRTVKVKKKDRKGKAYTEKVEKAPIFRDSIIGNIQDLVKVLKGLNVTNDPNLEKVRSQLEADICKIDTDTLRNDKSVRTETAKKADAIISNLEGIF